jgi:hypothetical protein
VNSIIDDVIIGSGSGKPEMAAPLRKTEVDSGPISGKSSLEPQQNAKEQNGHKTNEVTGVRGQFFIT